MSLLSKPGLDGSGCRIWLPMYVCAYIHKYIHNLLAHRAIRVAMRGVRGEDACRIREVGKAAAGIRESSVLGVGHSHPRYRCTMYLHMLLRTASALTHVLDGFFIMKLRARMK